MINKLFILGFFIFLTACQKDSSDTNNTNYSDKEVICFDGIDNDGDGAIDCDDYDCAYNSHCMHEFTCDDKKDNDNDSLIDCDDDDCADAAYCNNPNSDNVLSVSVTTSSYGGYFAPRNCSVMWIQTPTGDFIKTIHLQCIHWNRFLTKWEAVSGGDSDGISGATRTTHGAIEGVWDLTDQNGETVQPGFYEFWAEYTEDNGTGVNAHGTIEIDGSPKVMDGTDTDYFHDFKAEYKSN